MPSTCQQHKEALNYIVKNVLDKPLDGNLIKAIVVAGVHKPQDLLAETERDIDTLEYYDDDSKQPKLLPMFEHGLLKQFHAFCHSEMLEGNSFSGDDWKSITQEQFDDFRICPLQTSLHFHHLPLPMQDHQLMINYVNSSKESSMISHSLIV